MATNNLDEILLSDGQIASLQSRNRTRSTVRRSIQRGLLLSGSAGVLAVSSLPALAQTKTTGSKGTRVMAVTSTAMQNARVEQALAVARKQEKAGSVAMAAVKYREATEVAPTSLVAARELARFYSRQSRSEEASLSWRRVMELQKGAADAEARRELVRAQNQLLNERGTEGIPAITKPLTKEEIQDSLAAAPIQAPATFATSTATSTTSSSANEDLQHRVASATLPAVNANAPIYLAQTEFAPVPEAAAPVPPAPTAGSLRYRPAPPTVVLAPLPATTNASAIAFVAPKATPVKVSAAKAAQAWPLVNRAASLLKANRTAEALTYYQRAYKINPANEYAAPGVATAQIILGRFNDAAATYRKYLAIKPGNPKALRGLADSLTYAQKFREALGVNNAILAKTPNDYASLFQNAEIATYLRNYTLADSFFRRAEPLAKGNAQKTAFLTSWGESLSYRRDTRALNYFNQALTLSPGNNRALISAGNYYSYIGQFGDAVPLYRTALAASPRNAKAYVALGDAETYSNKPEAAIGSYRSALRIEPNNLNARLGLGRALVYADRAEEGRAQLQQVLARDPQNAKALEALAVGQSEAAPTAAIATYQKLLARESNPAERARLLASIGDLRIGADDLSGAVQSYGQAVQLAPQDPRIGLTYAQLLSYQSNWDDAKTAVQKVLAIQPNNPQALGLLLQADIKTDDKASAQDLAKRLEDTTPASAEEALQLAQALRDAGNLPASQRLLVRAAATVDDPVTALRLADATRDAGEYAGAATLYQRLLTSNPRNLQARLGLAQTLIYQRDFTQAQTQIGQVLVADPQNLKARALSAQVQLRLNTSASRDDAVRQANAILAVDPTNTDARAIIGEVLTTRQRYTEAIAQYRAAVTADPDNLEARLGLARNLNYSRDSEGAISEYRELIRRVPADTLPRLELAQIYLDRNRFSEAEALYGEVLAMRRGTGILPSARRAIESNSLAVLPPQAREGSPIMVRANAQFKPSRGKRRVVVNNPLGQTAPSKAASSKNASSKKDKKRFAQTAIPPVASGSPDVPTAPVVGAPDTGDDLPVAPTAPAVGAPTPDMAPATPPATPDVTPPTPDTNTTPDTTTTTPDVTTTTPDTNTADTTTPPPIVPVNPDTNAPLTAADASIADQGAALRGLGEVRRRQERYDEAITFFQQAVSVNSNDALAHVGLAQSLRGKKTYDQALQEANSAIALDPSNIPARVVRAQLLSDTGQTDAAKSELSTLVASIPKESPIDTYLQLAQALNSTQNYSDSLNLLDAATAQYPNETEPQRLKADTLTFAKRYTEAIPIYDSLISADPQDVEAVLGKARVYNYSDQLPQAETTYQQVLTLQPSNYQATVELADVEARRSNYPESIRLYQSAIVANPADLPTRVELARVQRYAGSNADAEATLNQVLEADANNVEALTERGVLRGSQGSYAAGIADLQQALTIAPTDANAKLGLAEVQSYAGNYDESIKGYRSYLETDPTNAKARTELGLALSYSGQTTAALNELNTVLQANPNDVNAAIAKADVLARSNSTTEAVGIYNRVLAADPNNIRARTGLADAYLYSRKYSESIKVYDALIASDPTNTAYKIQRARALGYAGRSNEAVTALRAVVTAEPNNIPARLALAEAGTNSGNQTLLRDAIAEYRSILSTNADNVPAQIGLGRALSYRGNYKEATTTLNSVLAKTPDNADARYALAETQRFQGRYFDARDNYQKVLVAQPANSDAKDGLSSTRRYTANSIGLSGTYYSDSNGVRLKSGAISPLLRTRGGTIGIIAENGKFRQNGVERNRRNIGLLLAKQFGPLTGQLIVSRLKYEGGTDKTLFDLGFTGSGGPRRNYYFGVGRRDIYESDLAVQQGITATIYRAGYNVPIGDHLDLETQVNYYRYSDSNSRITLLPSLYYRFRPTNPSFRIGIGGAYDNSSETRNVPFVYYAPQSYKAASILADYVVDAGRVRYGISGAYALTNSTGNGNRPADTLFGFYEQDVSDSLGLFANGGIVRAPGFHSNQITGGVNLRF